MAKEFKVVLWKRNIAPLTHSAQWYNVLSLPEKNVAHTIFFVITKQVACALQLDTRAVPWHDTSAGGLAIFLNNFKTDSASLDLLITFWKWEVITFCCPQSWQYALQRLLHQQLHSARADSRPPPLRTRPVPSGSLHQPSGISCVPKEVLTIRHSTDCDIELWM